MYSKNGTSELSGLGQNNKGWWHNILSHIRKDKNGSTRFFLRELVSYQGCWVCSPAFVSQSKLSPWMHLVRCDCYVDGSWQLSFYLCGTKISEFSCCCPRVFVFNKILRRQKWLLKTCALSFLMRHNLFSSVLPRNKLQKGCSNWEPQNWKMQSALWPLRTNIFQLKPPHNSEVACKLT